jgi:hypothetical protein
VWRLVTFEFVAGQQSRLAEKKKNERKKIEK